MFQGAHFVDDAKVHAYRAEIAEAIRAQLTKCPYSLFVFTDSQLIAPEVLDVVAPSIDFGTNNINGVDYSKAVYIFQSNECAPEINLMLTQHSQKGVQRNDVDGPDMTLGLKKCLERTPYGKSQLFKRGKVTYIPFLPLTRDEVELCAKAKLGELRTKGVALGKWQGLYWSDQVATFLVDQEDFVEEYSVHGCKGIDAQIDHHVLFALSKANPEDRVCEWMEAWGKPNCHRYAKRTLDVSIREGKACVTLSGQSSIVLPCLN